MKIAFGIMGLLTGLFWVGILALLQWVVGRELPFSIWWGMLMSVPAALVIMFTTSIERKF